MGSFTLGLILFICIVPTIIIMYFLMYPRNWKNRRRIFGVNNRDEFKTEKSAEYIDKLVADKHKQATIMLIFICTIATGLLFVPGMNVKMMVYTAFVLIALFIYQIPYMLGNSELKKFKKALGIVSDKVLYADLKAVGNVHGLNKFMIFFANAVGLIIFLAALLGDLGYLPLDFGLVTGTFVTTGLVGSIVIIGLMFLPICFIVDNSRNVVISENSDINMNYNRSRKKAFSDLGIIITWISDAIALFAILLGILVRNEISMLILFGVYLLVIMIAIASYAKKNHDINNKYLESASKVTEDDDDNWVLGMFYYNPADKRLNVEKRAGIGMTINMAHPAGKVISGFLGLTLIGSLLMLIWIGMMGATPINVTIADGKVTCHHLWDEYVIYGDDIRSVEYGDLSNLTAVRTAGTAMENVAKGTFSVDGKNGCKLFLNPKVGKYIKITTRDKTYYISDNTEEETLDLYERLK